MSQPPTHVRPPTDGKFPPAIATAVTSPAGSAPEAPPGPSVPAERASPSADLAGAAPVCRSCAEPRAESPSLSKWLLLAWGGFLAIGPAGGFLIGRAFRDGYFRQLGMFEADFQLSWPDYVYTGFKVSFYIAQSIVELVSPEIQFSWIWSICVVVLAGAFSWFLGHRRRRRTVAAFAREPYVPSPGFRSSMALTFVGMLFVFAPVLAAGVLFSVALIPHLAEQEGVHQAKEVLKALDDPARSRRFPTAVLSGDTGALQYRAVEAGSTQYLAHDGKGLVTLKRERVLELRSQGSTDPRH